MDLRQLRYFVILAETLNFRRAAERLNMSQPPLTVSIRKLEEEFGAPLFTRSNRGLSLTPAGEAALAPARSALVQAERVRQAVRARSDVEKGRLGIGFTHSTAQMLPRLLPAFRTRYPHVELALFEWDHDELVRRLRMQRLDLALVALPLVNPAHLEAVALESQALVVAAPLDSDLARRRTVRLAQLEGETFIGFGEDDPMQAAMAGACRNADFEPTITQTASSTASALQLVRAGMGIALVAKMPAPPFPGVKFVALAEKLQIETGLAIPRKTENRLSSAFIDVARAEFADGIPGY